MLIFIEYEILKQIDDHFRQIGAAATKLFSNTQIYFPKVHPSIGCSYKQKRNLVNK